MKCMKTLIAITMLFSVVVGCTLYQSEGRKSIEEGSIPLEKLSLFGKLETLQENCAKIDRLDFLLPYNRVAGIFNDNGLYEVYEFYNSELKKQKVVVTHDTNNSVSYCQYIFDSQFNTVDFWTDFVEDAQKTLSAPIPNSPPAE